MVRRIGAAAAVFVILEVVHARAQFPIDLASPPPAQTVRDALAHPYGHALVAEFAKIVAQNADPACLRDKALDAVTLNDRGRDIFERYGTRATEMLVNNIDGRVFETIFAARAGATAKEEFARLRNEPAAQQYLSLERPIRLVKVLDFIVVNFDRYALITRIKMKSISPISIGNDELMNANRRKKLKQHWSNLWSTANRRSLSASLN